MRLLLVEDDRLQSEWLLQVLKQEFPKAEIDVLSTELAFQKVFTSITEHPPDVVVMDVMLRWTDPSPRMAQPPPEVEEEGFYRAGLRCCRMLAENERTKAVSVILYTILDREDIDREREGLPRNVHYIAKSDSEIPLIKAIRQLARLR